MTNFTEILKYLIEGKKVRRFSWKDGDYLQIIDGQILNKNNIAPDLSHLSTLIADDWEIFQEHFRLSDWIEDSFDYKVIPVNKIKESIRLLNKEIKKKSSTGIISIWQESLLLKDLLNIFGGKLA